MISTTVPTTTPEFRAYTATDYANLPDDQTSWVIRDLLPVSGSAMIYGPPKARKPLALDTPILTTDGWKTMGTLTVGDFVYGPHGRPARVAAKSDIFYDRPCYRVTFSDNSSIVCDAEHPWEVLFMHDKLSVINTRKTTAELAARVRTKCVRYPRPCWSIALAQPLTLPERHDNLPIDPYVLGAWLGDGTRTTPQLTTADRGIRRIFHKRGYPLKKIPSSKYSYQITHANDGWRDGKRYGYMRDQLRQLNLIDNKHIPDAYLYGSLKTRMDLLYGLLDTDGGVSKSTAARTDTAQFYNKNERLVHQVAFLARSLGGKATILSKRATLYGKDCGIAYTVVMRLPFVPFLLGRKQHKCRPCQERYLAITKIEPVDSVPVQCITIDDPQHLFLAGTSLVPTCNTLAAQQMAYAIADPDISDWLSFPVETHGPVLYLQLDTARVIWKDRIRRYRDVNGFCAPATDQLHIADKQSLPFPFEILNPVHFTGLRSLCQQIQPVVVFIDVLRKATMAEESNSEGMIQALNALELAVKPAGLVLISHARKPQTSKQAPDTEGDVSLGSDNRGSSSLPGNVDGIIKITKKTFSYLSRTLDQNRLKLHWDAKTFLFTVDNKEFDAHLTAILADPNYTSDAARAAALSETSGRPVESCRSAIRRKKGILK